MKRTKPKQEKPEKVYKLSYLRTIIPIKRKHFAAEYCRNGWNATNAYKKAYNVTDDNQAAANGSMIIRNNKVKQYIAYIKDDYEMLCGVSKAKQVREYSKIAYSSIIHLHNTWIKLEELEELKKTNPEILDAIESTESKTENRIIDKENVSIVYIKIKLHSKIAALQRIDKLMDYEAAEKIEHSGGIHNTVDITKYSKEEQELLLKMARKHEYTD